MEPHFNLTDHTFEEMFFDASLEPSLFTHEAHLRLAWIHISKYGEEKAIQNITTQIQNYVRQLGVEDKYNETLTVAAIKIVHHFKQKKPMDSFKVFISTYPVLKTHFKDLLAQHYGFDIYTSDAAKAGYLEPDLLAFTA